jgi:NAD(P)-dependent dehydrogenase (short-subunit alcohol dehydrogenase family)
MNLTTSPHTNVLIIGASRGLGLAIAKQYLDDGAHVVATVRGASRTPLHDLQTSYGELEIETADVTSPDDVESLRDRLATRRFDLLFHNAGAASGPHDASTATSTEDFIRVMVTNALSPMRVIDTLKDLVTPDGTIAIMSSGQGSITNNERGGFEVYRASKSALNQLMRSYAARNQEDTRTFLLMAPGWVKTALGGPDAKLTIEESIPNLVATVDAQRGHGGLQFLDYRGETVTW